MCGIVGIFNHSGRERIDPAVLTRMRDTMVHRGPDGADNWISNDGRVGLGHRRLSIIDLSTAAAQPMPNEDGTVWVTYNGEIYNHEGLRRELIAKGHRFRTDHSDTEVILHGYEEWGLEGLLQRIEGDYAAGIWDAASETLSLFRDRIGVKPLYFALQPDAVLFASEIKAILAKPGFDRDVDPTAMFHYLSFLAAPAPFTMFKGVYKLPAGHYVQIGKGGTLKAERYWDALPPSNGSNDTRSSRDPVRRRDHHISEVRRILTAAVEKRMMSDVPFGVFLSGGIDSSTNVALMSEFMTRPVDTFTVGFKDHTHLNELDEARLVAKRFKTNQHEILIDEKDMRGYLGSLIHHQDEPIADWVCIPLYFVSKLARDSGVTVVQVGEGSDEQFCGYASYMGYLDLYRKYWQPYRRYVPSPLRRVAAGAAQAAARVKPGLAVYADIAERASFDREHFWSGAHVFHDTVKRQLVNTAALQRVEVPFQMVSSGLLPKAYLEPDSFNIIQSFNKTIAAACPDHDILARMIYNEFKLRLPELLLMRVDKIGMSTSIEARVPFLDHHLVEYTMGIPIEDKVHANTAKYILKKAVEGLIPDEIIHRKKMGFGAPMAQWMSGSFGEQVRSEILSSRLLKRGFFNVDFIKSMLDDHRTGRRDTSLHSWTLYNLTAWYDYWIDGARG